MRSIIIALAFAIATGVAGRAALANDNAAPKSACCKTGAACCVTVSPCCAK